MASDGMIEVFYREILIKVYNIELHRKRLADTILMIKEQEERLPYERDFLVLNLAKHRALEQAAVAAIQNQAVEILNQIGVLYGIKESSQIIDTIRGEIAHNEELLELINKKLKNPRPSTFVERRMLQEIHKMAAEQARQYKNTSY